MRERVRAMPVLELLEDAGDALYVRYRCADPQAAHLRLGEALRAAGFGWAQAATTGGRWALRVRDADRVAPARVDALLCAVALLGPIAADGPVSAAYAARLREDGLPDYCGFAVLWRLIAAGIEIARLGPILDARVARDPEDPRFHMDVGTLLILTQLAPNRDIAFAYQRKAIGWSPHYVLPPQRPGAPLRLLALAAPGDMTANTHLDLLLENTDVELHLVYVQQGRPLPDPLPEHDLVFVAIGESPASRALLSQVTPVLRTSARPVLNRPEAILEMSRDRVAGRFASAPGLDVPMTRPASRNLLLSVSSGALAIGEALPGVAFPLIVRPLDSQGGRGLERVEDPSALGTYLAGSDDLEFFVAPFIDYRDADGQYRKYRVAAIRGRMFPCHMAVSSRWMVHYVNADMDASEAKRAEEARFLSEFDQGFGARHAAALQHIDRTLGLDYYGLDCAETPDGRLLVFEIDTAMLVHAMDPEDLYPYKKPAMRRLFAAFREMLGQAAAGA